MRRLAGSAAIPGTACSMRGLDPSMSSSCLKPASIAARVTVRRPALASDTTSRARPISFAGVTRR
jgi:hypothetical protein